MKITCKYQVLFGQVQVQVLWHFHTPSTQVNQVLINMYLSTSTVQSVLDPNPVLYITQDTLKAMLVVFFCTHKTYLYAQNEISYEYIQILFKNYIQLHKFANCNSANYDV